MTTRILTTHVGSLPRTRTLLDANRRHAAGELDDDALGEVLAQEVAAVVARQAGTGIDVVNDGEYGHRSVDPVDYSAWWTYSFARLSGVSLHDVQDLPALGIRRPRSARVLLTLSEFTDRRDWKAFHEAYAGPSSGIGFAGAPERVPVVTGPLTYTGADDVAPDARLLVEGLAAAGFVAALSPGSLARLADALRTEYRAVTDTGLTVQVDAPTSPSAGARSTLSPPSSSIGLGLPRASRPSTGPWRASTPPGCACTCAGAPGTGSTPRTSASPTSSTSPWRSTPTGCPSRPQTCATSTSGACGRPPSCPRASTSCPGSCRTPPTSWSTLPRRRPHRAPRPPCPSRARRRLHRLRPGRTRSPPDRLGQARRPH